MNQVYQIITDEIVKKLEQGVVPWHKPWSVKHGEECAHNWVSGKPYRGINAMLLDSGEYATFKQIQGAGGHVKKGEHGNIVVFYKLFEDSEDETKKIPYLRYYKVFEINRQCEGLESKIESMPEDNRSPLDSAEEIVKGYKDSPKVLHGGGEACYVPGTDTVKMPKRGRFERIEEYYSTLFHELVHSTGHKNRLSRTGVMGTSFFGSREYSKEELVAEVGASMLCSISGIGFETLDNSTAYINSWLRTLKGDSKMVVHAAGQAQKAADYIQGVRENDKA